MRAGRRAIPRLLLALLFLLLWLSWRRWASFDGDLSREWTTPARLAAGASSRAAPRADRPLREEDGRVRPGAPGIDYGRRLMSEVASGWAPEARFCAPGPDGRPRTATILVLRR